jgi:hypothetical protein
LCLQTICDHSQLETGAQGDDGVDNNAVIVTVTNALY